MLLRSASSPVLDSLIGHQTEPDLNFCARRCRSVQVSPGRNQLRPVAEDGSGKGKGGAVVDSSLKRVQSDTDLNSHLNPFPKLSIGPSNPWARRSKSYGSSGLENILDRELCLEDIVSSPRLEESLEEEGADEDSVIGYGSFSHLTSVDSGGVATHKDDELGFHGMKFQARDRARKSESELQYMYSNGGYGFGNGGRGGAGYGGQGGGSGSDSSSTDAYYQRMLQANPDNPLLLRNYARFLHEVQHDLKKAEEYYGRTILASPCDGDALSLYAKLIWDVHKDAARAESYFDRAVEASPDDCYVLGSYAHFLWNAGDGEEDAGMKPNSTPTEFFGTAAAAS